MKLHHVEDDTIIEMADSVKTAISVLENMEKGTTNWTHADLKDHLERLKSRLLARDFNGYLHIPDKD